MNSLIGYNVHSKDAAFLPHCERLKPRVMFFMNDWLGAAQFQTKFPACYVIHRISHEDEAGMHLTPGRTRQHLIARAGEIQDRRVYINLFTEPDNDTDAQVKALNDECLDALQWAKANNVRVALPHLKHYGMGMAQWMILEPLINEIANSPVDPTDGKPLFILCIDSYGGGHLFSGVVDPSLPGTNETAHISPANWKASPINKYWHVGREIEYMLSRLARGLKLPIWFLSEFGLDRTDDIGAWLDTLKRNPIYPKVQAWETETPQLEEWYGQNTPHKWSPARAYAKMMLVAIHAIYSQFIRSGRFIGACIYCYGTNNDPKWKPFRVDNQPDIQNELEAQSGGGTVVDKPPTTPVHARVKTLPAGVTVRNMRDQPNTGAALVSGVSVGEEVFYHPSPPAPANGGWLYVRSVPDAKEGWVLGSNMTFEAITTPPDNTEVEALKAQITTLQIQLLAAQSDRNILTAANAVLSDAKLALEGENVQLKAERDNYRAAFSGVKGLMTDIHALSGELAVKAGHAYNVVDGALEHDVNAPAP